MVRVVQTLQQKVLRSIARQVRGRVRRFRTLPIILRTSTCCARVGYIVQVVGRVQYFSHADNDDDDGVGRRPLNTQRLPEQRAEPTHYAHSAHSAHYAWLFDVFAGALPARTIPAGCKHLVSQSQPVGRRRA